MRVARANSGRPDNPPVSLAKPWSRKPVARQRRVRHDDAVDAVRKDHAHDLGQVVVGEIGRELDEQRRHLPVERGARLLHADKQRIERLGRLEIAQARRIGRGNIDGEIARHRGHALRCPST